MSSSKRKWKFRLRHIIEAIQRIKQYTDGISFEQFAADIKTFDAVVRNLTIIGEAARQIPTEIEGAFPEVPWAEMRALRNILTHEYDRVDIRIIWDTVQNDLPPLVPLMEKILLEASE
ncbi:MAG: DUF86 domain-containing protein [Dehalococcoidales bacterium]|nr:DUF86 domain-containing protein [Dehalococcoidales bacterium]